MEKKLRITLPRYIADTLEADCEEFHITKNYILNYIFQEMRESKHLETESYEGEKTVIQFNLNKHNRELYYGFLKSHKILNESEFFRKTITKYANQPKMKREIFIFQDCVKKLQYAISEKLILHITFQDGKKTSIEPYHIGTSSLEIANYLFCYNLEEEAYKNYRLCNIKIVYLSQENFTVRDQQYIETVKKDFDPFLSQGKFIKVYLTENGEKIYKNLKLNRPKFLNRKNGIYEFQCSEEKAKRYFSYFLDDAVILEPLELKNWFLERFKNAVDSYGKI